MTNTLAIVHGVGACPHCGYGNATPDGRLTVTCGGCQTKITLKRVRGVFTDARDCDDRCLYAAREWCACACGGANHGRGYSPGTLVAEVPEWVRARDAKRHTDKIANRAVKQQAKIDKLRAGIDALLEDHPVLAFLIDDQYTVTDEARSSGFYQSIAGQLIDKGYLSEAQVAAIERSVVREREHQERQAVRDAQAAKLIEAGVTVPTGRITVTGRIVSVKVNDSEHAFTSNWRMLVESADGWRVWGTFPEALVSLVRDPDGESYNNFESRARQYFADKVITFTAEVKRSDKDPLFGYFSRPTKVSVKG